LNVVYIFAQKTYIMQGNKMIFKDFIKNQFNKHDSQRHTKHVNKVQNLFKHCLRSFQFNLNNLNFSIYIIYIKLKRKQGKSSCVNLILII